MYFLSFVYQKVKLKMILYSFNEVARCKEKNNTLLNLFYQNFER
jgi:hypothetical protein